LLSDGSVFIYSLVTSRSAVPFRSVFYTVPPRCWAVYMERVLARMSSYVLAVPSV